MTVIVKWRWTEEDEDQFSDWRQSRLGAWADRKDNALRAVSEAVEDWVDALDSSNSMPPSVVEVEVEAPESVAGRYLVSIEIRSSASARRIK